MTTSRSPFTPVDYPLLEPIAGLHSAVAAAGIKYVGRPDIWLLTFDNPTEVAGVLTRSKCPSAPIEWCREIIVDGKARALFVNSGNANAFTGKQGREAVEQTAKSIATILNCSPNEILLASTGVIGEPLDVSIINAALEQLTNNLKTQVSLSEESKSKEWWLAPARTIMTTDTYPKIAGTSFTMDGHRHVLNGLAKGSGMIAPDMATMLAFLITDAPLPASLLQTALSNAVTDSFNAITVDSDTSTSDTVLLFSTHPTIDQTLSTLPANDPRLKPFQDALKTVCRDLAHQIVKDGEGARKFVEIQITGATNKQSARKIGLAIANSPLVKTAIAGEDANWGRIVMAVGKAGEPADRDKLSIWFGPIRVAFNGEKDPNYCEETVAQFMRQDHITIRIDLSLGTGTDTVWTCDLTKDYVTINGDYRS